MNADRPSPRARPSRAALAAGIERTAVVRVQAGVASDAMDEIAVEEPLEIRLAGDPLLVTMRTPGNDAELAAGLLLSEGLIRSRADLGTLAHCGRPGEEGYGNVLDVAPGPGGVLPDADAMAAVRRGSASMTAACGVCGRRSIEDLFERLRPSASDVRFDPAWLLELPAALRREQRNFARTGALHAAAAASSGAALRVVREDVGRHNAVDKVIGRYLLDDGLPASNAALVVSGRVSFEIVQKALAAGFGAVVAVSAPTSLAVQTARRFGLTLLGFTRDDRFNVYSGRERVGAGGAG